MNLGYRDYELYGSPRRGKFEGNRSERLAYMVYELMLDGYLDDEIGSADYKGWAGLVLGNKRPGGNNYGWIIEIDTQGFVYVQFIAANNVLGIYGHWAAAVHDLMTPLEWLY